MFVVGILIGSLVVPSTKELQRDFEKFRNTKT